MPTMDIHRLKVTFRAVFT